MQKWKRYLPELSFVALALFIGGIGGLLTNIGMPAFDAAQKPWFTPPKWAFPVVWTTLYILMGIGMGRVWKFHSRTLPRCLGIFGIQLLMNLFWTVWFFLLQWYGFAFWWLIALFVAVAWMTVCFWRAETLAGVMQVPYLVWLVLAGALNYGVWMMN